MKNDLPDVFLHMDLMQAHIVKAQQMVNSPALSVLDVKQG